MELQSEDQNILPCQIPVSETVRARDPKGIKLTFLFQGYHGVDITDPWVWSKTSILEL